MAQIGFEYRSRTLVQVETSRLYTIRQQEPRQTKNGLFGLALQEVRDVLPTDPSCECLIF